MEYTEISFTRSTQVLIAPGITDWINAAAKVSVAPGQNIFESYQNGYIDLDKVLATEKKRIEGNIVPKSSEPPVKYPEGESPERIDFRKRMDKSKTLADANTFAKEAKNKKMLDIYNDKVNQINAKSKK